MAAPSACAKALRCSSCPGSGRPSVGTARLPLPPLCAPLFAICWPEGAACHLSPTCSLPRPGGCRGLPQNNAGCLRAGSGLCFVSRLSPSRPSPGGPAEEAPAEDVKQGLRGQECGGQRTGMAPRLSHCSPQAMVPCVWGLVRPRGTSVSEFLRTLCKVNSVSWEVFSISLPCGCQHTQCVQVALVRKFSLI